MTGTRSQVPGSPDWEQDSEMMYGPRKNTRSHALALRATGALAAPGSDHSQHPHGPG
jgi:hypothetical protein